MSKREYTSMENTLMAALSRDREVILAMQNKHDVWWRCWGLFWRRPWRAKHGPDVLLPWKKKYGHSTIDKVRASWYNFWGWLRYAHDCSDPAVGCSCSGGYRFPNA